MYAFFMFFPLEIFIYVISGLFWCNFCCLWFQSASNTNINAVDIYGNYRLRCFDIIRCAIDAYSRKMHNAISLNHICVVSVLFFRLSLSFVIFAFSCFDFWYQQRTMMTYQSNDEIICAWMWLGFWRSRKKNVVITKFHSVCVLFLKKPKTTSK